jgi:hypothetical protein
MRIEKMADKATTYADFFRTRGNRWRLAIIIFLGIISQYSGNALFSNYMNTIYIGAGITNQNQKLGVCSKPLGSFKIQLLTGDVAQHRSDNPELDRDHHRSALHRQSRTSPTLLGVHGRNGPVIRLLDHHWSCLRQLW